MENVIDKEFQFFSRFCKWGKFHGMSSAILVWVFKRSAQEFQTRGGIKLIFEFILQWDFKGESVNEKYFKMLESIKILTDSLSF